MAAGARRTRSLGRYALCDELAAGGMATVHFGRLLGPAGFARTVAIKRLHAQYAKDPEFVAMFLDEARLAARIRHPNVVSTLDVIVHEDEVFLVMEYIHGDSLSKLFQRAALGMPLPIVCAIMASVLHGLHAAHEARDERGDPLRIIHRDVSPQNILVGADGIARVLDFGVAKAVRRLHTTGDGSLKGKLRYMAPEQLRGEPIDRRVDVFSASIVLWEMLTGRRLFQGEEAAVYVTRLLADRIERPCTLVPDLPPALDDIVMRGLTLDRADRFATARDMAVALESAATPATAHAVGAWVESTLRGELSARAAILADIERGEELHPENSALPMLGDHLQESHDREARSQVATEVSLTTHHLPAGVHPALAATDTSLSTAVFTPPRRRSWPAVSRVVLGVALVGVVAIWASWPSAPPAALHAAQAPPPSAEAKNDPSTTDVASLPSPSGGAGMPSVTPDDHAGQPPPRVTAASRANHSPVATPKAARPVASGRSTLCMKQRPDGIVYFEPCP
jgi:serine/threonine protein kinase